jgi:hypothetical protein
MSGASSPATEAAAGGRTRNTHHSRRAVQFERSFATCRHPACPPTPKAAGHPRACTFPVVSFAAGVPIGTLAGAAATESGAGFAARASVRRVAKRVEVPAVRSSSWGWSPNERRPPTSACASPPSLAMRQRGVARSSTSGASWWAREADARGREMLVQSPRAMRLSKRLVPELLELPLERIAAFHTRVLIAHSVAMRPGVAPTKAAECGRATLIQSPRAVRLWVEKRVLGAGVRASAGRAAANRSRFPPCEPVREAGPLPMTPLCARRWSNSSTIDVVLGRAW